MRWLCAVLAMVAVVSAAEAQLVWVGAGSGISWEWKPDSDPGRDWVTRTDAVPYVFVGFPVDRETLFRVRAVQLPYDAPIGGEAYRARLRGYTAGVDYFMTGVFGEAVFSAGVGGYHLEVRDAGAPGDQTSTRFGWYLGIGEWFQISERIRVTAEVQGHRTGHAGKPTLVTAQVGVAVSF